MPETIRARILGYLHDLPAWQYGRHPGFGLYPLELGDVTGVRLEVEIEGERSVKWATREDG